MPQEKQIPSPKAAMYGVAINSDGTFENIGIGAIDAAQADEVAKRLVLLASALRAAGRTAVSENAA